MNDIRLDLLARGAQAPQGRRFALKSVGLAALAAVAAAPLVAEAGNNNSKNKNRKRRRNRKQGRNRQECPPEDCTQEAQQAAAAACQTQVALCEQEVRVICARDEEDEQECLEELLPCCASLGTCNVTAFFACVAPPPVPNVSRTALASSLP